MLDRNRRCSTQIFDAARRLIALNTKRFTKTIEAFRESPFEWRSESSRTMRRRPSG